MPSTGAGSSIKPTRDENFPSPRKAVVIAERVESLLLGGTVLYWTGRQGWNADPFWHPVTVSLLLFNMIVALLLICRTPAQRVGSWQDWLWALPCVAIGGFFFHFAPRAADWELAPQVLFVAGVGLASVALLSLGRSFSVLPAVRTIARRGPYQWVRHPAYLGETLMAVACFVAAPSGLGLLLLVLVIPFAIWRIQVEEHLLSCCSDYEEYARRVRWRLVPGLW